MTVFKRRQGCIDDALSRRGFLGIAGLACGGLVLPQRVRAEPPANDKSEERRAVRPFNRYSDLLETVEKRGHKLRVLGFAPDKSPIVGIKAGGGQEAGHLHRRGKSFHRTGWRSRPLWN